RERADGDPARPLRQIGLRLLRPRGPRDIQVHPRQTARELLQEQRRGDRTGGTAARVEHVGDVAPDLILVFVEQRQLPDAIARPPGMFSVVGTTPMTLIGALSVAIARIAQTTAAPPAMSSFIRSMPSAGLMEMPPVSKVMPLPTRPRTGDAGAPGGSWRMTISRGGSLLPRATPSSMPMPSASICFSSNTSNDR